jgi:hypothetical protein
MKHFLNILAAFVAICLCHQTSAAIFNPNDVASLIAAINTSNTNGEDDTIELTTNGTYTLTAVNNGSNGLPVILSDSAHTLVIHGNGATLQRSTAGGTPAFRIFQIGAGADVTIDLLTIMNGNLNVLGDSFGAGIYNTGTLTVTNSILSGNSATSVGIGNMLGGGIYNTGTLTVANSTLSGNSAISAGFGGGIYNTGTVTVTNSTLSGNSAIAGRGVVGGFGGGIYNTGTLTVTNSTCSGNSAIAGGGISNVALTAPTPTAARR